MHTHRPPSCLAAILVLLSLSAASFAAVINVDFGTATSPAYSGTAVAPTSGTFWNAISDTQAQLFESGGLPTSVGVEFGDDLNMTQWSSPVLAPDLMTDYLYAFSPEVDQVWITGLDANKTYDLYLYSQNGATADAKTMFTVGGVNKTVTNAGNGGSFAFGRNYTHYTDISPDAEGKLSIQYSDLKGVGATLNGFQLVGNVSATPPVFATPSRGRQILLNRGLQLVAHELTPTFDFDVGRWLTANFTTINFTFDGNLMHPLLLSRLPEGHQWARWYGGMDVTAKEMPYIDNFVSIQYWDELDGNFGKENLMEILPTVAAKFRQWNALYPNTMACTSVYGGQLSASELRTYMRATEPDFLFYDFFPGYYATRETWYQEMQKYRTVALEGYDGTGAQPIPYGQQTQASRISYSDPLPGEAFVRQQQFASWAFGFTYMSQWLYRDPLLAAAPGQDNLVAQMFSCRGDFEPTIMFDYVAETNRQSRNLGPALIRLVSTDVRIIPGKKNGVANPTISNIPNWIEGSQNTGGYADYITDIVPLGDDHLDPDYNNHSDAIVGYFRPLLEDNAGYTFVDGLCFMIVNGNAGGTTEYIVNGQPFDAMGMNIPVDENGTPDPAAVAANTAEALGEWYHVAFDFAGSNIDSLVRLSRETGEVELVPLHHYADSKYYITLYLPGGTGDLFTFWDSSTPFPTITREVTLVPETSSLSLITTGLIALPFMCLFRLHNTFSPAFAFYYNRKYLRLLVVAFVFCSGTLAMAASINVDFGQEPAVYSGLAAAPDTGTLWNRVSYVSTVVSNLADSSGAATSVGVEFDISSHGIRMYNHTAPLVAPNLMKDYLYALYPDVDRFWITDLAPGKRYDLYLYSQNGIDSREGTNFVVNGLEQVVKNPVDSPNFVLNESFRYYYGNYVRYLGAAADENGKIAVYYEDALGFGASVNGFQLLDSLIGDANGDRMVDSADAAILAANWQRMDGATWADGDFNGDGAVDDVDATLLAANWSAPIAALVSVPEPALFVMLFGGLIGLHYMRLILNFDVK